MAQAVAVRTFDPGARSDAACPPDPATQPFVATRAFARLCASQAKVTLIAAPPGFGKTRLLRALSDAAIGAGQVVDWRDIDRLAHWSRPELSADLTLLDDAQDADRDKLATLIRTVTARAADQRFVLATRTLPDFDWFTLEAAGRLEILRAEDLGLDEAETAAMLRAYATQAPPAGIVAEIQQRTEGWPIAVQWHGMLASRRGHWRLGASTLGPREDLAGYLNEAIYRELDEPMRRFLFRLAALPRFSADLLIDLIPRTGPALLEQALRENLMLTASSVEGWYRLHGIFQAFLKQKMRQADIAPDRAFLIAASEWFNRNGHIADSIDLAFEADAPELAQGMLVAGAEKLVRNWGELPRLLAWVGALEQCGAAIPTQLRLWKAWALILLLRVDEARAELGTVEAALPDDADASERAHYEKLMLSVTARGDDVAATIALADRWMDRWAHREPYHVIGVTVLRGLANLQTGRREAAQRDIIVARRRLAFARGGYGTLWVSKAEAFIELRSGRVSLARQIILGALDVALECPDMAASAIATIHLLAARVLVEADEGPAARRHLSAGQLYVTHNGLIDIHIAAMEAAVLLAEDSDGVDAALLETRSGLAPGVRYAVSADLLAVQLLLRHNRADEARDLFAAAFAQAPHWTHVGTDRPIPPDLADDVEEAQAWLALAAGKTGQALTTANRLLPAARCQGAAARHLRLTLLAAAAAAAEQLDAEATRHLARGLKCAAERGLRRTALDCGWAIRSTLLASAEASAFGADAYQLLRALRARHGVAADQGGDAPRVERLTSREMELLALLDSGMTSQAIADSVRLGLSTTKWHIQNIYNKFGVRNRTGALACARRLALID